MIQIPNKFLQKPEAANATFKTALSTFGTFVSAFFHSTMYN